MRTVDTDDGAAPGYGPVSTEVYISPELFRAEIDRIFRPGWHALGRVEEFAEAGGFKCVELPAFKTKILLIRDRTSRIRAFHNACTHRAHPLKTENTGRCNTLICPFHNWTFDLDGQLLSVPDQSGLPGLEKSKNGLREFACDSWAGFVFVCLDNPAAVSLEEYLGEQARGISTYPFESGTVPFSWTSKIDCNWKLLVDSFCETYHIPGLHRHSLHKTFTSEQNPHWRPDDVRLYGDHRTVSVFNCREHRLGQAQELARKFTSPGLLSKAEHKPSGLNTRNSNTWAVDVTVFFPGWILVLGHNMYFTHQMQPIDTGKTQWTITGYFRPAKNAAQRFGQEHAMVELRDATLEDTGALERIQENLDSGLVKQIHLHESEVALRHHHGVICRHLGLDDFAKSGSE